MTDIEIIHRHLLLIRDPVAVLSSWGVSGDVHGNSVTSDELGIVPLLSIYSKLESRCKVDFHPAILESDDLVKDPSETLSNICDSLSIPYKESMLSWESGPHACDGPWAKVSRENTNICHWKRTRSVLQLIKVVVRECAQVYRVAQSIHKRVLPSNTQISHYEPPVDASSQGFLPGL